MNKTQHPEDASSAGYSDYSDDWEYEDVYLEDDEEDSASLEIGDLIILAVIFLAIVITI